MNLSQIVQVECKKVLHKQLHKHKNITLMTQKMMMTPNIVPDVLGQITLENQIYVKNVNKVDE